MPRSLGRALLIILAAVGAAGPLRAQDDAGERDASAAPPAELPWQMKLGLRVRQVDEAFALIDRLVIVPDEATYLDELSRWSPRGRWPVLFEDDRLAPMFVRRFKPAEVIHREPIGRALPGPEGRQRLLEDIIISAWGGVPGIHGLRETFQRNGYTPPGVVIASVHDPAWTAAVALAAGRGEPIAWLNEPFGRPGATLPAEAVRQLRRRIDGLVAEEGYPFAGLGDAIDAITLCRAVAGKADIDLPAAAQPAFPPSTPDLPRRPGPPYAITDLIGRHEDGSRYAVTGWIFGDEKRCAYMGMCSLFLPRRRVSFYNTYPDSGQWAAYGTAEAAEAFSDRGYEVQVVSGEGTSVFAWQRMLAGGISADVIIMNSSGMSDYFDLVGGRAYPQDVPILTEPAAVHLIHSWSLAEPDDRDTVGGRWLERGAYAYVGSAHEPFLGAFVPPSELARRCISYGSFLVAARHYDPHPLACPWKINTLGDPLMLLSPPDEHETDRIAQPAGYGTNVGEQARTLVRACAEDDADGATFAAAIAAVVLLGRDEIAARLWPLAEEKGFAAEAAGPALGPLFRMRYRQAFLRAWRAAPHHDEHDLDMLWHIMGRRLRGLTDEAALRDLEEAIRRPNVEIDLRRLAPELARVLGREHVRKLLLRELEQAEDEYVQRQLRRLLEEYH